MQEYSYSKKQFGTTATISLVMTSEVVASHIANEVFETLADYEARFSRFLPTSELSKLNSRKSLTASNEFIAVLGRSYELYKATNGVFNPLVQINRQGYVTDFIQLGSIEQNVTPGAYNIDFNSVSFDIVTKKIILQNTQQLDFGGVLKGYVAEKIARGISETYPECQGVIVNLGGDLHTRGVDADGEPFIFMIYNPILETEIPVALTNTSLATSGTYKRTWETSSGPRNHILSPDGNTSATSPIISASVIHEDGTLAEAFAKVLLIQGNEKVTDSMKNEDYRYVLITTDGEILTNII